MRPVTGQGVKGMKAQGGGTRPLVYDSAYRSTETDFSGNGSNTPVNQHDRFIDGNAWVFNVPLS